MPRTPTKADPRPKLKLHSLAELKQAEIELNENWHRDRDAAIAAAFCERVRIDWDAIWLAWGTVPDERESLEQFVELVLSGRASLVKMTNAFGNAEARYKLDQYARSCESRWEFAVTLRDRGEADTQLAIQRHDQNLRYAANPVD